MRNLKRALSLTLASVMLLGMMVVGSSAAGYPDVDSNDNAEAIEVLQAVKVMVGDDNGNFNPDDQVNRAQMAVVMALLLDLNYDYYQGADPGFWDVPSWAAPYVAACYANGIVSGYGNGQYGSADPVTAVQAASMMMRALGYFQYQSDYKEGFELATVSQASKIRLFDGIDAKSKDALTRNEVAQLALNTLKTPIVEPDDNTFTYTDGNGNVIVSGGQVNYVVTASSQPFARAIGKDEVVGTGLNQVQGYVIELGEQLYNGKLELRDNDRDDFGRPARTWVYNGSEIGSYAKKELLVEDYTEAVKGKTIYELLGQSAIRDNELYTYLDGANNSINKNQLVRSYDTDLAGTGRGVLTEVYLDTDHDELTIVSINTWLAQASVDYNANSESITLTVYDNLSSNGISKRVDAEDAPFIANMKKDDWCLVQWADESDNHGQKTVVDAFDVEIREDQKVTSFKRATESSGNLNQNDDKRVTEIITGGETIKNNAKAYYKYNTLNDFDASALVNKTYTVFMDQYDNFIGVELYSGKDQYVFITGYDRNGSNISVNTAKASAIFTDGTMQAIDVNVKATNDNITAWLNQSGHGTHTEYARWTSQGTGAGSQDGNNQENMWYQYTEDRGVYTLTPVDGYTKDVNGIIPSQERNVNSSKVYLSSTTYAANGSFGTGNSYGEDASIYITVDNGDVDTNINGDSITEVTGVYTGAQDVNLVVPSNKWIHAVWKDNYIVAAIVYGDAEGTVENYAYIRDGISREWIEEDGNGNRTHYWEFDAVMNGEKVTKTIKSRFSNTVNYLKPGQVQELIIDNDGYVTSIKDVAYPGNNVREDKLWNNIDFNNDKTNGKDTLKGNNVYHVETGLVTDANRQNGVVMPTVDGNGDTLLAFQGNTLRYNASDNDLALPVARNAKAVVCQTINNSKKWENYDSVGSAYSILNDADGDSSSNKNGAKQFDGQVIAVLDSNGVAAWVVFIDNTPTDTTNPNYNTSASNTIGNVDVYVRSSNVNIVGRNIGATIGRYGDLIVSIPVANDVVSATASNISVTVDGVTRFNGAYTFDIVGNEAQFTLEGKNLDSYNDIVVNVYGFSASTKAPVDTPVSSVDATLAAPVAGEALPDAVPVPADADKVTIDTIWTPNDATAVAGKTYVATFNVKPKTGYVLAEGFKPSFTTTGTVDRDKGTITFTVPEEHGEDLSFTVADGKASVVIPAGTGTVNVKLTGSEIFDFEKGVHEGWYLVSGLTAAPGAVKSVDNTLTISCPKTSQEQKLEVTAEEFLVVMSGNDKAIVAVGADGTMKSYPVLGAAKALTRSVVVDTAWDEGAWVSFFVGGQEIGGVADAEQGVALKLTPAQIQALKSADRTEDGFIQFDEGTGTVEARSPISGDASAAGSDVVLQLTTPKAAGVKLPTTINVDDAVEAEIKWYETVDGVKTEVDPAELVATEPLDRYSCEIIEPKVTDEEKITFPVTIKTNDEAKQYVVENKDVFETITVETTGEIKNEDVTPEPVEPDMYKVNVTITPEQTASVKVNDAVIVADGYEEGTEIVLTVEAVGTNTIKSVTVDGQEVTLDADGKYNAGAISDNMDVEVTTEPEPEGEPATLTLVDGLADSAPSTKTINVMVTGKDAFEEKETVSKPDSTGATTYTTTVDTLKVDDEVTIFVNGLANVPGKGDYVVGESKLRVTVDNIVSTDGVTRTTIKFTMTGDVTLGVDKNGKLTDGASSAVETLVVTVEGGVKGIWKDKAASNKQPDVTIDKDGDYTVPKGGEIVITNVGTGTYVITENIVAGQANSEDNTAANGLYSAASTASTNNCVTVDKNVTLRSASLVKIADGAKAANGPIVIDSTTYANGAWVPVGTVLNLTKAASTDGFYADYSANGDGKYGTDLGTTYTTGTEKDADGKVKAVVLQSGVKLNMEEGISATCGAASNVYTIKDTDLVKGDTDVNFKVDPAYGTTAVLDSNVNAGVWAKNNQAVTADQDASTYQGETIRVMTKVTFPAAPSKVTLAYLSNGTSTTMEVNNTAATTPVFVVPNSTIQANVASGTPTVVGATDEVEDLGGGVYQFTVGAGAVEIFVGTADNLTAKTIDEAIAKLEVNGVTKVTLSPEADVTVDASQIPAGKELAFGEGTSKNVTVSGNLSGNLDLTKVTGTATMSVEVASGCELKLGNKSTGNVKMNNAKVEVGTDNAEVSSLAAISGYGDIKINGNISATAVPLDKMAAILGGTVVNTVVSTNKEQTVNVERAKGHIDYQSGGTIESYWPNETISSMGASSYISTYHFAFSNLKDYNKVMATFVKETNQEAVEGVLSSWMDISGEDVLDAAFLVGSATKSITFYFSKDEMSQAAAQDAPTESEYDVKVTFNIPTT